MHFNIISRISPKTKTILIDPIRFGSNQVYNRSSYCKNAVASRQVVANSHLNRISTFTLSINGGKCRTTITKPNNFLYQTSLPLTETCRYCHSRRNDSQEDPPNYPPRYSRFVGYVGVVCVGTAVGYLLYGKVKQPIRCSNITYEEAIQKSKDYIQRIKVCIHV